MGGLIADLDAEIARRERELELLRQVRAMLVGRRTDADGGFAPEHATEKMALAAALPAARRPARTPRQPPAPKPAADHDLLEIEVNDIPLKVTARQSAIFDVLHAAADDVFVPGPEICRKAGLSSSTLKKELPLFNHLLAKAGAVIEGRRPFGYRLQNIADATTPEAR